MLEQVLVDVVAARDLWLPLYIASSAELCQQKVSHCATSLMALTRGAC